MLGEAYNVGSAFEITNLEVAVRMLQLFGCTPQADFGARLRWVEDRPFNDYDYRVDGSKLQALGWRQRTSFEKGLGATVEWYRENLDVWWPGVGGVDGGEEDGKGVESPGSMVEVDPVL